MQDRLEHYALPLWIFLSLVGHVLLYTLAG